MLTPRGVVRDFRRIPTAALKSVQRERDWPNATDAIAPIMNNFRKHVASRTMDRADPLILGSGKRLFREEYRRRPFEMVESKPTTKGVLVARYRAAS